MIQPAPARATARGPGPPPTTTREHPTALTDDPSFDFDRFDVLTFDCYGTLIDWEAGIEQGLRRLLGAAAAGSDADELLEAWAGVEPELEAGPYLSYREILAQGARRIAARQGIEPRDAEVAAFAGSVGDWPPFPDSTDALVALHRRFRLGVITNCDDDLFAPSNRTLGVTFDWVVTAQQAQSYKPSARSFELAFERIDVPLERILHVAQSLYHDHVPARRLGMTTAWIDRRRDKAGFGATPAADAAPDLIASDTETFARLALRT